MQAENLDPRQGQPFLDGFGVADGALPVAEINVHVCFDLGQQFQELHVERVSWG